MKITEVHVDRFDLLQNVDMTALSPGLNVVFAPDAAARTALARALRHMLFGPEGERPASTGSGRLGSVTIEHAGASYRLIRIDRTGHPEAFAICAHSCETVGTEVLRTAFAGADRRLVDRLYFVAADQWDCRDELPALIDCLPRQPQPVTAATTRGASPAEGPSAVERQQRCEQLRLEISTRARSETRRQQEYAAMLRRMDDALREADSGIAWFDAELQAAICDLRETEDRLWRPDETPAADEERIHGHPAGAMSRYVEHLREVIGDLAERRLKLSRLLAEGTGGRGAAQHLICTENERLRIDRCEAELLHQLRHLEHARAADADEALPAVKSRPAVQPVREEPAWRAHLDRLNSRGAELRRRLDAARSRHSELSAERRRLHDERRRIAADCTLDTCRYELGVAQQQLADADVERQALELLDAVRSSVQGREPTGESVRRRASALLRRLVGEESGGPVDPVKPGERPVHGGPRVSRSDDLAIGATREQAALALRLALLSGMAEGGCELPAVWEDALGDNDRERLPAAARLLAEVARNGQQFILLTGRSDVAEAFAKCGATRHDLATTPTVGPGEASPPLEPTNLPDLDDPAAEPLVRIHPAEAHWLRADSALNELPSLGAQMARQLRRMGLVDVGDLIALDLSRCGFLLSESRLTADQVRLWQAEAVLLCCVPDLTGRDAQLLVSCGVLTPAELAATRADELALRIDRLRGGDTNRWHPWVGVWPRHETVRSWVHAARRARPLEAVFSASASARRQLFRSVQQQGPVSAPAAEGSPGLQSSPLCPAPQRHRLRPDSPVVDAPSIGHKTARLLQRIGIVTIGDLLACDTEAAARRLRHPRLTADVLLAWQRQAGLMCAIPDLRCGDAQVLVACGIHRPADLLRISASALYTTVGPFVETAEGRRLLRSATPPTAEDVARWVESAQSGGLSRAA